MKYKTGQNVDIGDGSVWRIIDIEDDVIEIETVGAVEYETLFVDGSEIESEDYWHDAIYDANFKDLKLNAKYPGCVYFDVTFPYEYDIKNNNVELSETN